MNKEFFKKLKEGIISTTLRFPGVIFFTILAYILFPYRGMIRVDFLKKMDIFNLIRYGLAMSFMIEIVLENLKQKNIRLRLICYGVMTAILLGMLGCGFFNVKDSSYLFVYIALVSVILIAFAHKERGSVEGNYVVLMWNSLKAGLFALLFIVGEVLVLFLFDRITNIVSMSVYREVIVITYLFIYTYIYYSSVPRIGDSVECPKYLKNIIKFIFIPFTLLAEVLGEVYLMQDMKNIIRYITTTPTMRNFAEVWLIIIAISVFIVVFIDVIAKVVENELIKICRKVIAGLLIPAILAGVYLIIRLYAEAGITIILYMSVMTFLVATAFIVDILVRNSKSTYIGLVVLAILSIIASIKPFSPERVEERSQLKRKTAIVNEYYITRDNRIEDSAKIEI